MLQRWGLFSFDLHGSVIIVWYVWEKNNTILGIQVVLKWSNGQSMSRRL